MTATAERSIQSGPNPLYGMLLAGIFPLFLGAALSDYAYYTSFHIQWATFASWLLAGGLVFNGFAILGALVGVFRSSRRGLSIACLVLLLISWILGFVNALIHAKDAWAMMPMGLVLSVVITVLAGAAILIGFTRASAGDKS